MTPRTVGAPGIDPRLARLWPLLLFLLAVLVRLPKLTTIPAPTDEVDELLVALTIYRDGAHPLTTSEPYLGPLFVYLLAGAYTLLGPTLTAARTVALVSSALVAPAAAWLGASVRGPVTGLAAGALALGAFGLVVGGHVAWSHGEAPTLVTAALACLVLAAHGHRPRLGPSTEP